MNQSDEILTARKVAGILKISRSMVYKLQRGSGGSTLLPRCKFGEGRKGLRWMRGDVEAFITANTYALSVEVRSAEKQETPLFIPVEVTDLKSGNIFSAGNADHLRKGG